MRFLADHCFFLFTNRARFPLGSHDGILFFRLLPFMPESLLALLRTVLERNVLAQAPEALVIVSATRICIFRPGRPSETI